MYATGFVMGAPPGKEAYILVLEVGLKKKK
jgi:hypothetical protein